MRLPRMLRVLWLAAACAGCTGPAPGPWTEPVTGMKFLPVPAGSFVMGSPAGEPDREAQERPHRVTLTHAFWLGTYEVTQREWRQVMGTNPSWFDDGNNLRPVENVTWYEVGQFLDRFSTLAKVRFRLPTEAEWEYACRAGTTTPFSTGASLPHEAANFAASPERAAAGEGTTRAVGSYPPNPWGFHDLHGNVWEWTASEYCPYPEGEVAVDPNPACRAPLKVIRGGSFYFGADSARCALRYTHDPADRGFSLGFRVARDAG